LAFFEFFFVLTLSGKLTGPPRALGNMNYFWGLIWGKATVHFSFGKQRDGFRIDQQSAISLINSLKTVEFTDAEKGGNSEEFLDSPFSHPQNTPCLPPVALSSVSLGTTVIHGS